MTRSTSQPDQWLFTPAQLRQTPSQADGYTFEQEMKERWTAIDFVQSLILRTE